MFKKTLIFALIVLLTSSVFAGEIITVSGKIADTYKDQVHMYVNKKFMRIEKVPQEVIKKIKKLDENKIITLKIEKKDEKIIFISIEKK
jgi:hypothetical protein